MRRDAPESVDLVVIKAHLSRGFGCNTLQPNASRRCKIKRRPPIVTVLLNGYLAFEKRRRRRRALALTHTLDDHALKDIGLQRFDISSVAAAARADRRR